MSEGVAEKIRNGGRHFLPSLIPKSMKRDSKQANVASRATDGQHKRTEAEEKKTEAD